MPIKQGLRFLVVEDNPLSNRLISNQLEDLGHQVVGQAFTGSEGVKLTKQLAPDVVLMDLRMADPETGQEDHQAGIKAALAIQAQCPTPVVVLTAYEVPDLIREATAAGIGAYLLKPPNVHEIERAATIAIARFDDLRELQQLNSALQDEIKQRKQAEEKAKRYAEELERSNEELEQFAQVISHDLREPVRMVKGYLKLLNERYRDVLDEEANTFIDYALDGAIRMQEMIKALLDLSRVETHGKAFAPVDVKAVLEHTLRVLSTTIEEAKAEISHDPLPTVMVDEAQLRQVFQNLIANALKFRREGVALHVHISATPLEDQEGEKWCFSVSDNGIGIKPDQVCHIFQIFQRLHTREEYPGMGIGLALCKRIVARHGGCIWVESAPGQGSTFYFTLPAQA